MKKMEEERLVEVVWSLNKFVAGNPPILQRFKSEWESLVASGTQLIGL